MNDDESKSDISSDDFSSTFTEDILFYRDAPFLPKNCTLRDFFKLT